MNPPQNFQDDQYAEQAPDYSGFLMRDQKRADSGILNRHLSAKKILIELENMLLSRRFNDDRQEWESVKITVYDENGKNIEIPVPPLMNPGEVRLTISFLRAFLDSNTFLSELTPERINDIMWDVNCKLACIFYKLRRTLQPHQTQFLWGMIEYPILFGISRAGDKITLDAMSKMQHTIENINPKQSEEEKKGFKLFGF